ncbi:MAG: tail fiber protein [Phascolarctobacterium sp.]|nr:tail fiber protein [Phascolarctobacterium sp.]
MLPAIVSAGIVAFTSMGVTKLNQAAFGGYNTSRVMLQAQQYAEAEAAVVKVTAYSNLTSRSKVEIQNSNGYYSEVLLSSENDYADGVKQRIACIKVYKGAEELPRYTLNVLKTDAEVQASGSGVPVGTVIAWAANTLPPNSGDVWLECNGQSCSAYPALVAVLGKSTVPDYRNRFLEGHATAGTIIDAGLPNITGQLGAMTIYTWSGAFSKSGTTHVISDKAKWGGGTQGSFDASKSNAIYGKSTTVQPPAVTVKFLIKAA